MTALSNGCSIQLASLTGIAVANEHWARTSDRPRASPPACSTDSFADELVAATATVASWDDWLRTAAALTHECLSCTGVLIWQAASADQSERLSGLTFPAEGLSNECCRSLRLLAEQVRATDRPGRGALPGIQDQVIAIRLQCETAPGSVLFVLLSRDRAQSPLTTVWLSLVATCAELWSRRRSERIGTKAARQNQSLPTLTPGQRITATSRRRWIAAAAIVALAVMILPVPYEVRCDCELQPVLRRYVAAPFEGLLEQAFVEVGDHVTEGQLLARMDGKEVRWDLAGNRAEFERAAKERDAHLADQDFGEAQLAKLQMERLGLTTRLLEDRQEHLDIRSPIDGIIVSGEQKRAEGARLAMGQSLFEVAPLDRLIVEVLIPESELAHVAASGQATIRLEAYPGRRLTGPLDRICPRAELRNQQQVFVGEIPLPNDDGQLRPGMRGRVSLPAGHATLGWSLFHRAWNRLQMWWGV